MGVILLLPPRELPWASLAPIYFGASGAATPKFKHGISRGYSDARGICDACIPPQLHRAPGVSIYFGASGAENQSPKRGIPTKYSYSRGVYATFSFRKHPLASGVSIFVGAAGTETQRSDTVFTGNVRILGGLILFLAPVTARGLPVCPYMSGFGVR